MNPRHALVVGVSSGIGLSLARRLKQEGYIVSGISRRTPPVNTIDTFICCDVLDSERLIQAIEELAKKHGIPKVVAYSAGYPVMGDTLSVPEKEARTAFEVNFWGLDKIVRAVLPKMKTQNEGVILAVLSFAAICPVPFESYYSASKAAVATYLRALALETREAGVKLKWIAPGYVDTGFLERGNWFGMSVPHMSGSGMTTEKIAETAVHLIKSNRSSSVIGWKERCLVFGQRLSPGLYRKWMEFKLNRNK
jgi:short-subunit dehydrogenase